MACPLRYPSRMSMGPGSVFISYRRSDTAVEAATLGEALAQRLGAERVFVDYDGITAGVSFADSVRRAIETCEVMLVLIGPRWLAPTHEGQAAGLSDIVHSEVATALRLNKQVVPVLVGGAPFPRANELPDDMRGLALRNTVELRASTWAGDVEQLFRSLFRNTVIVGLGPRRWPLSWLSLAALWEALRDAFRQRATRPDPPPPLPRAATPRPAEFAVFLSHASADRALVVEVMESLESAGLRCWVSFRDLAAGEPSWAGAIVGAIAHCALMVVVVSKHAVGSRQVLREVTIADSENIPVLPYCIDTTPLSNDFKYFFVAGQRLDATSVSREDALPTLVAAVRSRIGKA